MGEARRVVEQLVDVINRHDLDGGGPLFASTARCVGAGGRTMSLEGLRDMLQSTLAAFPDLTVTVQRWVEQGDTVVTEELFEGTHVGYFAGLGPTGRRVRLPMAHIYTVRDGAIVERIAYHDTAGILRQLTPREES